MIHAVDGETLLSLMDREPRFYFLGAIGMLVIGRRLQETVAIIVPPSDKPQTIEVVVTEAHRDKARLAFIADRSIRVHRKAPLQVGQTWEGKSKEATSMSRRKITALTPDEVHWEAVGLNAKHTSGRMSPKTFRNWTRRLIVR